MAQNTGFADSAGHSDFRKVVFIGNDQAMLKVVTLSIRLRWPDVSPIVAKNAEDGLEIVEQVSPDVVVVAATGPEASPAALVEEVRSFSGAPILVLSRDGDEMELVTCLELGADDYIRFPCSMMEIMARMWASLRRVGLIACRNDSGRPMICGELLINPATYEVFISDRRVSLTVTEFRLLHLLAKTGVRWSPTGRWSITCGGTGPLAPRWPRSTSSVSAASWETAPPAPSGSPAYMVWVTDLLDPNHAHKKPMFDVKCRR